MNRWFPPFSLRYYLGNTFARFFLLCGFLLFFPCALLLSENGPRINELIAFLDPPDEKEVPDQSEPSEDASDDREALIHRIYRSRSLRNQFERAEAKIQNQEFTEGALQLEKLLDHQEDYFFWPDDQPRPINFRQETRRLLSTASPRMLADYERISGPQANWLLKQAQQENDLRAYELVALQFFPLRAGFDALNYLAAYHMEQGNFEFAARYWDLLLSSRVHQSRMKPIHFLKAALAYQQSGQTEKVTRILSARGETTVTLGSTQTTLELALLNLELPLKNATTTQKSEWPVSQGNARRNKSTPASLPYLNPRWSKPVALVKQPRPLMNLINWEGKQLRENHSPAITNMPIAVENLVIYRDFEGIRAVDLESGKTAWQFQSPGSLNHLISHLEGRSTTTSTYSQNLPLQKYYNYGSLYGSLSSNGQYVFAVDYLPDPVTAPAANLGLRRSNNTYFPVVSRRGNRLLALPLKTAQANTEKPVRIEPAWDLAGYYFFGAPLPVGGFLYVVAEHNSQISLLCLNPQDGTIHWKQGIAFVNQPIITDHGRSHLQCPLAGSQGIIVCTTQIDTLVAVDATNGDLLWNYYYGDGEETSRIRSKRYYRPVSFGHPGLTSTPLIEQNRVYYLPDDSPFIHCIDLQTGEPLWNEVPREDSEYIAAVVGETVLMVGSEYCRGRHLKDGEELWHLQTGPVSGKGFLSEENYLLPISEGSVLSIHVPSGKESGFTLTNASQISTILNQDFKQKLRETASYAHQTTAAQDPKFSKLYPQKHWYPGNLIAHKGNIISLGLWQMDVFSQAESMRSSLASTDPGSIKSTHTHRDHLLRAELDLALGNLSSARETLDALLSVQSDAPVRARSESLLRELLYAELNQGNQNDFELLANLETLANSPLERGRFLSRKSKYLLEQQDYQGLLEVAEEFHKIDVKQPLAMAGDTNHLVTVKSMIAGLMEKVATKAAPIESETVDAIITTDQRAALKVGSPEALESFLETYGSWSQATEVRSVLAEKLIQRGENQRAEFLLMENREADDPVIAATATRQLLELWQASLLPHEAATLLRELSEKFADVTLDSGLTGGEYVQQFDRSSEVWKIFQTMQPLGRNVSHVTIRQKSAGMPAPEAKIPYKTYESKFLPPPEISQLLLKTDDTLKVINKYAGQTIGKVKVSDRISYPYRSQNARVGHFIPLGSSRKIHGVSLLHLEDDISDPLWTAEFEDLNTSQTLFYVGPSGPRVCIFQWGNRLFGLNSATGKVLWERKNIPSKSGFLSDSSKGLIGDQKAVVAFNINRISYDVYSSITGELIRKGELDLNSRARYAFGRKLFYETTSTTEKRVRLWDPLTDRFLLDEPVSNFSLSTQVSETELAILLPPNRLRVLNVETGETVVESVLPEHLLKNLNKFVGFADHDRYYFNFSHSSPRRRAPQNDFYVSDSFLNVVHVDKDLVGIDKKTGKVLWDRNLPKRSWIDTSQYQLPFLIFISKIRTESRNRNYSFLLEVLDAQTGKTIGFKDNLFKDTILQMHIDPRFSQVILQGMNSAIELDFKDRARSLENILDDPL